MPMPKKSEAIEPPSLSEFDELTRRLVQVPKSEVDAEQKKEDRRKARRRKSKKK